MEGALVTKGVERRATKNRNDDEKEGMTMAVGCTSPNILSNVRREVSYSFVGRRDLGWFCIIFNYLFSSR